MPTTVIYLKRTDNKWVVRWPGSVPADAQLTLRNPPADLTKNQAIKYIANYVPWVRIVDDPE